MLALGGMCALLRRMERDSGPLPVPLAPSNGGRSRVGRRAAVKAIFPPPFALGLLVFLATARHGRAEPPLSHRQGAMDGPVSCVSLDGVDTETSCAKFPRASAGVAPDLRDTPTVRNVSPLVRMSLPSGAPAVETIAIPRADANEARRFGSNGCSGDMVRAADRFCIDRYEASMIDGASRRPLSPYYPPAPKLLRTVLAQWSQPNDVPEEELGLTMPFPNVPAWQESDAVTPLAVSLANVIPQGYVSQHVAARSLQ